MKWLARFSRVAMAALLCAVYLACLTACSPTQEKYTYDFFDTFDTYVQITAYAADEDSFLLFARDVHERMLHMHKLFDIYHEYDGINNAATVNKMAGKEPVAVDPLLIELVLRCQEVYDLTQGTVNIALGPVLSLWHDSREAAMADPDGASLPGMEALKEAALLCDARDVIADLAAGTLFLRKEGMRLDLGAAAKGYAVEVAARDADKHGVSDYLISAGGNVLAKVGEDSQAQSGWNVGVMDPAHAEDGGDLLDVLSMREGAAVTSGDYQRYFVADGVRYGHIIDPQTLMPPSNARQVTVIGPSSLDADILSTTLFILPYDVGRELVEDTAYDAIWVFDDGSVVATEGARKMMRERSGEKWL
jgi:thiamine biosynthesis lipoprotein